MRGLLLLWSTGSKACEQRPLLDCGVRASHCGDFSCCGAQALGHVDFCSCGTQAYVPSSMWDHPGPGIETVLAGGVSTTGPPGSLGAPLSNGHKGVIQAVGCPK